MQVPSWMFSTKFGRFLLLLPIWIGAALLVVLARHALSGRAIDWSFVIVWAPLMTVLYTFAPPLKWREWFGTRRS